MIFCLLSQQSSFFNYRFNFVSSPLFLANLSSPLLLGIWPCMFNCFPKHLNTNIHDSSVTLPPGKATVDILKGDQQHKYNQVLGYDKTFRHNSLTIQVGGLIICQL